MAKHIIKNNLTLYELETLIAKKEKDGYEVCGLSIDTSHKYTVIFKKEKTYSEPCQPYVEKNPTVVPVYIPSTTVPQPGRHGWEVTCTNNNFSC